MTASKYILVTFSLTLVASLSGAFFNGTVYADGLLQQPTPLRQNEPIIAQANQIVIDKQTALSDESAQLSLLAQKRDALTQQLQNIQTDVKDLQNKIAAKKAEAEAERARLDAIKNMFVHINRYSFDSAGNNYVPGNCTWYVKSRRPDISNSWGNANTWYFSARSQGWSVGATPKKGAVGTTTSGYFGHVVYVEGVSLDGKWVTISEMNYGWVLYKMNTRTVYYTEFMYIYELN